MNILFGFILFVSFSISAQVVESNGWWHKTRNWFPVLTALKGSVQAALSNDPLQQLKRIRELLAHIAESTSSVSKQQHKEELRTELSLLDSHLDSEEEEKEAAALTLWFIPVALLPPMHQLPGSTGAAASGGNPGDPNPDPASQESALGPKQIPIFNTTLVSYHRGTRLIRGLDPDLLTLQSFGDYVLCGCQFTGNLTLNCVTQAGSHFLYNSSISGNLVTSSLKRTGGYFLAKAQVRGDLEASSLTRTAESCLSGAKVLGNLVLSSLTQAGNNFMREADIQRNVDLSSLPQVEDLFLYKTEFGGPVDLSSLTQTRRDSFYNTKFRGPVDLKSLPSHRRPNVTYGWFDTCASYWSKFCKLVNRFSSEYLCSP